MEHILKSEKQVIIIFILKRRGNEKNKGGMEDGKCSVFSSHCGDRRSFVSETENMCFRFRSTPAD